MVRFSNPLQAKFSHLGTLQHSALLFCLTAPLHGRSEAPDECWMQLTFMVRAEGTRQRNVL